MTAADVQAFFERYRDAFNALDGDAVADLWHSASGITDSRDGAARLTWWPADGPMRDNHRALCDHYRRAGYGRASFEIDACVPMGPHHAFARVQWTLWRQDGTLLQRFGTGYQLLHGACGLQVLLAVAYQEDLQQMTPHAAV
jgi:hypothetical protein